MVAGVVDNHHKCDVLSSRSEAWQGFSMHNGGYIANKIHNYSQLHAFGAGYTLQQLHSYKQLHRATEFAECQLLLTNQLQATVEPTRTSPGRGLLLVADLGLGVV